MCGREEKRCMVQSWFPHMQMNLGAGVLSRVEVESDNCGFGEGGGDSDAASGGGVAVSAMGGGF